MNKKFVIIAILALFFEVIFIQNSSYAFTIKSDSTYKNLDFETATKNGKPKLWFAGGNGYEISPKLFISVLFNFSSSKKY